MKLQFIANDSARKTSFKRRMKSLNKKLNELSTLCGVDACAIVHSPYEPQPDVWPNRTGVQNVLAQFMRVPVHKRLRYMVSLEGYIKEMIKKTMEERNKLMKKNKEQEMTSLMYQCLTGEASVANLNVTHLNDLGLLVDQNLLEINNRIESLKKPVSEDGVMAGAEQPIVGTSDTMNMMKNPKSFMDLLMGPE